MSFVSNILLIGVMYNTEINWQIFMGLTNTGGIERLE